jgi:transposase InsO family protein
LHPTWGGEKLRKYLLSEGYKNLPKSEKTFDRILKRYGLITAEESEKHKAWKRFEHEHPNDLWQMDFKGYFKTLNGPCHPLTLLDDHSRYCLLIRSCGDERGETVKEALTQVFREYGLPRGMTMDNGSPWGYSGEQDHTYLTAWLIRLGIKVSHSRPNHPQTQGKLERFHRTLKEELISAYQFNDLRDAQEGFDWWRSLYNEKRPHGALSLEVPSSRYRPSERDYPLALPTIEYDEGFIIRKVQVDGTISFKGKEYRIGKAFSGQPVGLKKDEEESIYHVYFCHQKVVKIDLKYSL